MFYILLMELSPSREAANCAATRELRSILCFIYIVLKVNEQWIKYIFLKHLLR
jgi:hypothetical protein